MIVTSQSLLLAARHDFGAFESRLKMCNFQQFILQANMRFKNWEKKNLLQNYVLSIDCCYYQENVFFLINYMLPWRFG